MGRPYERAYAYANAHARSKDGMARAGPQAGNAGTQVSCAARTSRETERSRPEKRAGATGRPCERGYEDANARALSKGGVARAGPQAGARTCRWRKLGTKRGRREKRPPDARNGRVTPIKFRVMYAMFPCHPFVQLSLVKRRPRPFPGTGRLRPKK